MNSFIYGDSGWGKVDPQVAIKATSVNNDINDNLSDLRRKLVALINSSSCDDYNLAIKLHRQSGSIKSALNMAHLGRAQPLKQDHFPAYWRKYVPQLYIKADTPEHPRLLACFTGKGHDLNMPITFFHSVAIHKFDAIAYFFDERSDFYAAENVEEAFQDLLMMRSWQSVSLLGASSGGPMALRLMPHPLIKRRLAASPPVMRDPRLMKLLMEQRLESFDNSRIFFASINPLDNPHYQELKKCLPSSLFDRSVYDLSWVTISHGTLAAVMLLGVLPQQLDWLRGE